MTSRFSPLLRAIVLSTSLFTCDFVSRCLHSSSPFPSPTCLSGPRRDLHGVQHDLHCAARVQEALVGILADERREEGRRAGYRGRRRSVYSAGLGRMAWGDGRMGDKAGSVRCATRSLSASLVLRFPPGPISYRTSFKPDPPHHLAEQYVDSSPLAKLSSFLMIPSHLYHTLQKNSCQQLPFQLYRRSVYFSTPFFPFFPPSLFFRPPSTNFKRRRQQFNTYCRYALAAERTVLFFFHRTHFIRRRQPPPFLWPRLFTITYSCASILFSFGCLASLFFLPTTYVCTYSRIGHSFDHNSCNVLRHRRGLEIHWSEVSGKTRQYHSFIR